MRNKILMLNINKKKKYDLKKNKTKLDKVIKLISMFKADNLQHSMTRNS